MLASDIPISLLGAFLAGICPKPPRSRVPPLPCHAPFPSQILDEHGVAIVTDVLDDKERINLERVWCVPCPIVAQRTVQR